MGSDRVSDAELGDALRRLCAVFDFEAPESWSAFLALAHQWGRRMNLTAARDAETLAELLFLDAIQLLKSGVVSGSGHWLDVGAGVGAPTIPIALCRPGLRATLVEPRRKRVAFLRNVVGTLGLVDRVDVREARIDPDSPSLDQATFTLALSRATFAPRDWIRIGLALADEVLVFAAGDPELDATPVAEVSYRVPSTGAPRALYKYAAGP